MDLSAEQREKFDIAWQFPHPMNGCGILTKNKEKWNISENIHHFMVIESGTAE